MNRQTKVILRTVTTVMVCLAIVFAFLISAIRIFGLDIYGVLTGSMEPTYPVGSLIYVKKVDPEELRVRDVITYSLSPNTVVTHRIVELVPDENNPYLTRFRTKGDANNDVDASLVGPANIIGKVVFSIPHLGNVANYIQNPPGIYVAIAISIALIVIVFITDNVTSDKNGSGKEEKRIEMPWLTNLLAKVGITWPKPETEQAPPQPRQMDNLYPQPPQMQPQPQYQQPQQYQAQPQYPQQQYQQPQPQYPYQQPQYPQQYQQPQYPQQAQPQYPPQYQQPQAQYQQPQYPQQSYGQASYPQQPQQRYPQQSYQQGYPERPAQPAYPQQPRSYPTQANQLGQQPQRRRRSDRADGFQN